VFRCSPFTGATFACHLAIGDSVNDQHHNEFFMSVGNLAKKARVTRRSAQTALRKLVGAGCLVLLENEDGEVRRYRFEFFPQAVVYESRGRRDFAPPAKSTTSRGRNGYAQTQGVTQMKARGASHDEHFSPGSGVIRRFPKAGSDDK
jgi:hypothetical protein